jgi:hypothetical protein
MEASSTLNDALTLSVFRLEDDEYDSTGNIIPLKSTRRRTTMAIKNEHKDNDDGDGDDINPVGEENSWTRPPKIFLGRHPSKACHNNSKCNKTKINAPWRESSGGNECMTVGKEGAAGNVSTTLTYGVVQWDPKLLVRTEEGEKEEQDNKDRSKADMLALEKRTIDSVSRRHVEIIEVKLGEPVGVLKTASHLNAKDSNNENGGNVSSRRNVEMNPDWFSQSHVRFRVSPQAQPSVIVGYYNRRRRWHFLQQQLSVASSDDHNNKDTDRIPVKKLKRSTTGMSSSSSGGSGGDSSSFNRVSPGASFTCYVGDVLVILNHRYQYEIVECYVDEEEEQQQQQHGKES